MTAELRIAATLSLPLDAVTETFGILAVKRAGKSNAAVVIAEEMYRAGLPWVAIDPKGDWWGLRSSRDGKGPGLPIVVFGGLHADVPLEATAGHVVADLVVDQRLTCVLDVSEMSKADQRRFLTDFVERLYKRNREPLHVFCEEADEYIPQMVRGDVARMVGAFETLVKRGGFRGLGCTLITQRSASLNKDVLTQVQTLFALRTTSPQDRKAILGWIEYHAQGKDVVDELPALGNGEAWLFSPHWLKTLVKIQFRRRETFDSGSTPQVGVKARPPVTLADVDLAALRNRMAATIEKAKADDPKELRRRIAELEKQLRDHKPAEVERIVEVEKIVEVPILVNGLLERLEGAAAGAQSMASDFTAIAAAVQAAVAPRLEAQRAGAGESRSRAVQGLPSSTRQQTHVATAKAAPARPSTKSREEVIPPNADSFRPSTAQQRILDSLAWLEAVGLSPADRTQLALLVKLRPTSGGYKNYLGNLRSAGLIDYPSGGQVGLTAKGRGLAKVPEIAPTAETFQEQIFSLVGGSQRRILQVLIAAYPEAVKREDLADAVGLSQTSGGYKNYLGQLRTLGLIEYPDGGYVVAEPVLFLEGG